jgi:2-oxoglutarate dehydrogenase E2 component (dihydrolipoamide succinyltransferase)
VKEDDTVTVGQEIAKLELGGEPSGAKKEEAKEEPKEPAPKEQETSSQPSGEQEKEAPPPPKKEEKKPEPPTEGKKPAPPPPKPQPQKSEAPKQPEAPKKEGGFTGNREERRVSLFKDYDYCDPDTDHWLNLCEQVKMNRMRLRIAERLKQAQNTAASLSTFQEVDMSSLIDFRKQYKDEYQKRTGVKLGFMSAFARACVLAMKEIPTVNAGIEGPNGGDTIVYHDFVDISVAVATEKGLVTPVVRNVETMNLIDIERTIADLGKKARDNKLTIEDLAGGTFTISNGGVFGSLMSTPIINPPQSAVLGLHAIFNRAVPIDGKIEIRPVSYNLYLSLF